jgi:predicted secreted hydrolase
VLLALVSVLAACESADDAARTSFVPLRIGSVLGETDVEGFARADLVRDFVFPADHGAHPDYRSEWWYLTLTLSDAAGNDYGVQFTIFRQALAVNPDAVNPWSNPQVYLGHLAVTDVSAGSHREFERFARGHPELAGAQAQPFAVWLDGWRLAQTEDGVWLLTAKADDVSLRLRLSHPASVLAQGDSGLSRKGPEQASYYFSIPGFQVDGTLRLQGEDHQVSGGGWYDREWSTSVLSEGQTGWDWFALRFDSGASMMAFQLRRSDGELDPYNYAVSVAADGSSRQFAADEFTLQPQRYWQDPEGTRWPVAWSINMGEERLRIVAALDDQRMDTSIVYWEGLVYVYDQRQQRIGQGYMELTGYFDE